MGRMYLKRCCVPNCYNVKHYNGNKIGEDKAPNNYTFRLFKFPKDPKRCRKWLKLIGQPEMIIKTNTRICSDHFTKEDYFKDKNIKIDDCSVGKRCLKGTAVPSKWLPEAPEDNMEVDEDIDNDSEEPCLICGDKVKRGKRKRRRYKFDGGENLKLLNEQLWATSILREVLKVTGDKYGVLLGRIGASVEPGKWFAICEDCETSVVKILGWRKTIRNIEAGIREVEGILKNKLEKSFVGEEEGGDMVTDEILNVRLEIRKFLKLNYKNDLCFKKEEMVRDIIKKEIEDKDKQDDNPNFDNDDKFDEDWLSESTAVSSPKFDKRLKENVDDNQSYSEPSDDGNDLEYKPEKEHESKDELKKKLKLNSQSKSNSIGGNLKRKRKSKAKPKPSCNLCSYKAWSPTKMERHLIEHKLFDNSVDHTISTTQFYCNLCPISPYPSLFSTRPNLMRHKRINHPSELNLTIYQCPVCPESFFYKASYTNHLFKKHPSQYQSTLSTNSKSNATAITEEKSTNHDSPSSQPPTQSPPLEMYFCDKCNYSTLFKHQFTRHLKHGHTSVPYICQYCSSTYKYSWSLDKHIKRYHPEQWPGPKRNVGVPDLNDKPVDNYQQLESKSMKQKSVICNYCPDGTQFPHKLALNLHLKDTHKDLFKWQCNLCEKSYLRCTSLKTHLKINHLESGVKGKCEWCGKEVQHKTYLFGHWKICLKRPPDGAKVQEEENIN